MKFNYLKSLKKLTVIIFPEGTNAEVKSFRMNGRRVMIFLLVYSLFVALLGFYFIYFSPLENLLVPSSLKKNTIQEKQYEELSNKLIFLVNEIEKLKSTNNKLRKAVQLGDSTLLKNKSGTEITKPKNKNPLEGNVLSVFTTLIAAISENSQEKQLYFIQPVKGFVSREFKPERGHDGIDFVVKEDTPIYSSASGYVVFSDYTTKYGYVIIINHIEGYLSKYKHCNLLTKKEGDFVEQGELIALSGNSGTDTSGPHLHFEIWKDGKPINPQKVLLNY